MCADSRTAALSVLVRLSAKKKQRANGAGGGRDMCSRALVEVLLIEALRSAPGGRRTAGLLRGD